MRFDLAMAYYLSKVFWLLAAPTNAGETDVERLKREERALRERIGRFRAADRLTREDVHRRGV